MLRTTLLLSLVLAAGALYGATDSLAQDPDRTLIVGIASGPPFAMRARDGTWDGLGVDMWEAVAHDLGWRYELREFDLHGLRQALAVSSIDAGIGALPVTAENDEICDFSQPYLTTGLGLAQRATDPLTMRSVLDILMDPRLISVLGIVAVSVIAMGIVIALLERRSQGNDFGGPLRQGVSNGVWWAAVTMTTVGYGDTTPRTAVGRFLALLWMFIGVIVVAILTATVTSALTINHLRGVVEQPSDLVRLRLGVVPGGAAGDYLERRNEQFMTYEDYTSALKALADGQIDAVVANLPTLRYLVRKDWQGVLQVSSLVLEPESFAIAVPENSPLRKPLDTAVIRARQTEHWHEVVHTHLGTY